MTTDLFLFVFHSSRRVSRPARFSVRLFSRIASPGRIRRALDGNCYIISAPTTAAALMALDSNAGIVLGTGSALRCPTSFSSTRIQRIHLGNRTRFRMAGGPRHPFIMGTKRVRARMLNAVFSIGTCHGSTSGMALVRNGIGIDGTSARMRVHPKRATALRTSGVMISGTSPSTSS